MDQNLAFLNGQFVPAAKLAVPVDDLGFLLGVTVPEQLRTFAGKLFRLEQHLDRLFHDLEIVGIDPPLAREEFADFARELAAHNFALLPAGEDLGLTIFVTPGMTAMHTRPLRERSWAHLYETGQNLVTTPIRQVPADCWPAELKCRSRMHYWLADRAAQKIDPAARALLLDHEGFVTECSTANLVIFDQRNGLISPPQESILPGISVGMVEELAGQLGIPFKHAPLTPSDVAAADEVLLCSTSPCVWPVLRFNGRAIGPAQPGEVFRQLIATWSAAVGIDIVAQAKPH